MAVKRSSRSERPDGEILGRLRHRPLLVMEGATDPLEALYREDPHVCVWWGTVVECASAVARRERLLAVACDPGDVTAN